MSGFKTISGEEAIQGVEGGPWFSPDRNPFGHGCCDCGLFHQVEYCLVDQDGNEVAMPEGLSLALRFSTDHEETKRLRSHKGKSRLVAIMAGTFHDSEIDHLLIPHGIDCAEERKLYDQWYRYEYMPRMKEARQEDRKDVIDTFVTFVEWLKNKGATDPKDGDIEIYKED